MVGLQQFKRHAILKKRQHGMLEKKIKSGFSVPPLPFNKVKA